MPAGCRVTILADRGFGDNCSPFSVNLVLATSFTSAATSAWPPLPRPSHKPVNSVGYLHSRNEWMDEGCCSQAVSMITGRKFPKKLVPETAMLTQAQLNSLVLSNCAHDSSLNRLVCRSVTGNCHD